MTIDELNEAIRIRTLRLTVTSVAPSGSGAYLCARHSNGATFALAVPAATLALGADAVADQVVSAVVSDMLGDVVEMQSRRARSVRSVRLLSTGE